MNNKLQQDFNMMNMNGMNSMNGDTTNQIQQIINYHIMSYFTTGNIIIDMIIKLFAISFIAFMSSKLQFISSLILQKISQLYGYSSIKLKKIIKLYGYPFKEWKYTSVSKITDDLTVNDLYPILYSYLTSNENVDYTKEKILTHSCKYINHNVIDDKEIEFIIKPVSSIKNKIMFNNYEIYFEFKNNTITLHGRSGKQERDNSIIYLSTYVDETSTVDVFGKFFEHCHKDYKEKIKRKPWVQNIFINKGNEWTSEVSNNKRKLSTVILQNGLKDEIANDLKLFIDSKEWYQNMDAAYRIGYMFYGHPGTGKTSLIKALSYHYKKHIYYVMLQNIKDDNELMELMKRVDYKNSFVVIEDIDATISAVKSRDINNNKTHETNDTNNTNDTNECNKKFKSQITLSGLLNVLDGYVNSDNRILFMTSNHPEVIDKALLRPGRCDRQYQFNNCSVNQIKEIYEMYFNMEAPLDQIKNIKSYEYSPAHITTIFMKYRHDPLNAIKHLDDREEIITIKNIKLLNETNDINDKNEVNDKRNECVENDVNEVNNKRNENEVNDESDDSDDNDNSDDNDDSDESNNSDDSDESDNSEDSDENDNSEDSDEYFEG